LAFGLDVKAFGPAAQIDASNMYDPRKKNLKMSIENNLLLEADNVAYLALRRQTSNFLVLSVNRIGLHVTM